jgi:signal transduction histidine kinase
MRFPSRRPARVTGAASEAALGDPETPASRSYQSGAEKHSQPIGTQAVSTRAVSSAIASPLAGDPASRLARDPAPRRLWPSNSALGKSIAPAAAGAVAAGLAMACVWPALHTSTATAVVIVAVSASFAAAGTALAGTALGGGIGGPLVLASVLWALGWCGVWEVGPLPVFSVLAGAAFWATLLWGCLRYPHGRLEGRAERLYTGFMAIFLPALGVFSIAVSRPEWWGFKAGVWWPAPLADRTTYDVVETIIAATAFGLTSAFVWLARRRWVRTPVMERRLLVPVAVAFAVAGATAGTTWLFQIGPVGTAVSPVTAPPAVTLLGVPLAFTVAAINRRMARAAAADVLVHLANPATAESVRTVLAAALRDDTVAVLYRLPDSEDYIDGNGDAARAPGADSGRLLLPVRAADGTAVALVHADGALERQRDLVESAVTASSLAIENARLQAILCDQLTRVRASRARVAEAGLAERRRVERDLHDGAQQRLLTLAAWLGLARAHASQPATLAAIDQAAHLLQGTLDELRRLARGIHPAILSQAGLETALDSAAQALPIPVDLDVTPGRFDPTVETVAYLTTWDALTHLARAAGVSRATVRIRQGGEDLWVEVASDAATGRDTTEAPALSVIEDRLQAFDGELRLGILDGAGLLLTARIPCGLG